MCHREEKNNFELGVQLTEAEKGLQPLNSAERPVMSIKEQHGMLSCIPNASISLSLNSTVQGGQLNHMMGVLIRERTALALSCMWLAGRHPANQEVPMSMCSDFGV